MIPERFIEELKYRSDIEQVISSYVPLKRTGRNLKGLCPFHSEKTPSFTVYPENQSFYCFGCGAGGDVVTFIRKIENLEYVEALRFLAQRAGMTLPEEARDDGTALLRTKILEINRESARFFFDQLAHGPDRRAIAYLRGRGLSDKTIKRFGLGYAPNTFDSLKNHLKGKGYSFEEMAAAAVVGKGKNGGYYDMFRDRVMFPIIDLRGSVIGFGGRVLEGDGPKYLNSPDTLVFKKTRNLFAMNIAKNTKEGSLILAEGYMDVISIHQAGFDNAVASLGTSLTAEQARLISQYVNQVIIAYDADGAGQKATRRAISLFEETGVKIRVLSIPDAKDPDEYIKKFGPARFKLLLEGSAGAVDFEIAKLRQKFDLETADGKVAFLKEFCSLMAGINSPVERDVYIIRTAQELSVSKEAVADQVAALRRRRAGAAEKKARRDIRPYSESAAGQPRDLERSRNIRYALAEDKLITTLLKHPDFYDAIAAKIRPEQFVTQKNRELFEALWQRLQNRQDIGMMSLSALLEPEQMARVSYLLASAEGVAYTMQEAEDCMKTILEYQSVKTPDQVAGMSNEEWLEYAKSLAANKK
ncbi:DNA primase [Merdimmobilis hominis]|uniref:DNA primase n=1 Tax=uncultured Anaerotruncus sp. TaxID=905011 RepID=A0A6N2TC93_9FIRM|nr:DNA primase [Merdimmobilis hominis]MCD4835826.1 DNA primase [Merdimmobilis hominis]